MSEVDALMKHFCNLIIPTNGNIRKQSILLKRNRRTFHNWKSGTNIPSLKTMLKLLDEKGYTLQITLSKNCFK